MREDERAANTAVFLDRDGTINEDVDFLTDPREVVLFPQTIPALKALAQRGFLLIVVTNQSGVARGMLSEETLCQIHEHIDELLEPAGVHIAEYYYCPHHPSEGSDARYTFACTCRKPLPGLFDFAHRDFGIDFARSWCIGDSVRDLQAAEQAGVRSIWVRTGRTEETDLETCDPPVHPVARCDHLLAAAEVIAREMDRAG